jgi:hypothetical protein
LDPSDPLDPFFLTITKKNGSDGSCGDKCLVIVDPSDPLDPFFLTITKKNGSDGSNGSDGPMDPMDKCLVIAKYLWIHFF